MDASNAVYYPLAQPHNHEEPGNDSKSCSVHGCTHLVSDGSSNKMCDVCRSRHRIYASTKRARRKLEKAAVASAVAARNGRESVDQAYSTGSPPVMIAASWNPQNENLFNEATSMSHSPLPHSEASPSTSTTSPLSWNSIDPRLYTANPVTSSTQHVNLQAMSSSSELANALTLPLPRPEVPSKAIAEVRYDVEEKQEEAPNLEDRHIASPTEAGSLDTSGISTRFCSVKGCKAVLPATYDFKMCPPCRTRYRSYGITKRAKWKTERAAFDHEMAGLRILEDNRREKQGLPPLADNPEELRAWELSILDEQIPLSDDGTSSLAPSRNRSEDPMHQVPSRSALPPVHTSPTVMAGVYPATVGSIDTPHSISPYPHLNNPLLVAMDGPLPARMCTVSHCHKILPGFYRYKRCEQHRLQNRHHSKLKRVREKEIKALGPEDDATVLDAAVFHMYEMENDDDAEEEKPKKVSKQNGKGKGKAKEISNPEIAMSASEDFVRPSLPNNSSTSLQVQGRSTFVIMPQEGLKPKVANSREEMKNRPKYSCANNDCHNLLTPGVRWRTCDECRDLDRLRKMNVRAELKAAEDVYWKGVAQTLSEARRAAEAAVAADSSISARTNGSPTTAEASGVPSVPSGVNDEADAEGESDVEGDNNDLQQSESQPQHSEPQPLPSVEISPPVPPPVRMDLAQTSAHMMSTPALTSAPPSNHSPTFNSLTKQAHSNTESIPIAKGAFLKFRVELASNSPSNSATNGPVYSGFLPQPTSVVDDGNTVPTPEQRAVPSETVPQDMNFGPQDNLQKVETPTDNSGVAALPIQTTMAPTPALSVNPAPSVPQVPVKQAAKDTNQKGRPPTKGKSKTVSKKVTPVPNMPNTTGAMGAPSLTAPPTSFGPYGFPTSYPYYPYYMPPFLPQTGSPQLVASSSTLPLPMIPRRNYYHYPYPLPPPPPPPPTQSYGFGSPPGTYPYLPPRYTTAGFNSISGQQPYPGLPTPPFNPYQGYPFYTPPGSSISAPPAAVATSVPASVNPSANSAATSAPAIAVSATPASAPSFSPAPVAPSPNEPDQQNPSLPTNPSHYRFVSGDSDPLANSDRPVRKRRKVDTKALEIYKAIHAQNLTEVNAGPSSKSPPPGSATSLLQESSADNVEQHTATPTLEHGPENDAISRLCVTKTCQRAIPAEVAGTICSKCKLRFKKHQEKAKRKFKLEPRKFIVTKDLE